MASFIISDTSYEVIGRTVTVNYTIDVELTDVKLTKNGNDFVDPISFSQSCALFDISDWVNGTHGDCILRGWYRDEMVSMVLSSETIIVNEGSSTTFTVKLDKVPEEDMEIQVISKDTVNATVSPSSLIFTPSNYDTVQTVTVTGIKNADDVDKNAEITLSHVDMDSKTVAVTVKNTDIYYGNILVSDTALSVNENGKVAFTVKLDKKPTNNQNVTITRANSTIVLDKTSLTFTPSNYDTVQTVTVTGGYSADTTDHSCTVTMSSAHVNSKSIAVTVKNIDVYGSIVTNTSSVSVNEGSTGTFTVKLDKKPTNNQTVTLSLENNNVILNKTTLTFTPSNYGTAQTVTVNTTHNASDYTDKICKITLASSYVSSTTVNVTVKNIDTPPETFGNIVLNTTSLSVNEGSTGTFTVKLDGKPTNNQNVSLSLNNQNATIDKTSLTFTPSNYGTAQTVVVTGVDDPNSYDDKSATITISSPHVNNKTVAVTIVNTTMEAIYAPLNRQGYLDMDDASLIHNDYYIATDLIDVTAYKGMTVTISCPNENTFIDTVAQYTTNNYWESIEVYPSQEHVSITETLLSNITYLCVSIGSMNSDMYELVASDDLLLKVEPVK